MMVNTKHINVVAMSHLVKRDLLNDHFWKTGRWIVYLMMQLTACQHFFWLYLDSVKNIG